MDASMISMMITPSELVKVEFPLVEMSTENVFPELP